MSHYYKKENNEVRLLPDVTTPSQARKAHAMPSVTTILGYLPNDYINAVWKPQKYVELARAFPDLTPEEITAKMWGERTCPETGDTISSSEFGTRGHARIEDHLKAIIEGHDLLRDHPYDPVISPTLRFLSHNGFSPIKTEERVACERLWVAGTIDLIAEHRGAICLLDWKFRECPKGKGKFDDKDLAQLAVEAKIVKEQMELDYMPEIYSVCICADTGRVYEKNWSKKMFSKGLQLFMAAHSLYFNHPDLGWK